MSELVGACDGTEATPEAICGACHVSKRRADFSGKQWHIKTASRRRCSSCLADDKPLAEIKEEVVGPRFSPEYPNLLSEYALEGPGFHEINLAYPGIQLINTKPNIFIVNELFTQDECDRLMSKSKQHLRKSIVGGSDGKMRHSETRTSTAAVVPQREVPTMISKLGSLLRCPASHLESIQARAAVGGETPSDVRVESNPRCCSSTAPACLLVY